MLTGFLVASPGRLFWVTFVPGVCFAWALLVQFRARARVPRGQAIFLWYAALLTLQLLHFTEEYCTGFVEQVPTLYGGQEMSPAFFVLGNMIACAAFAGAGVSVFLRGIDGPIMLVLFFVGYGSIGNAVTHTTWVYYSGGYFPGFVTALGHAVLGPLMLRQMLSGWGAVLALCLPYGVVQGALVTAGVLAP